MSRGASFAEQACELFRSGSLSRRVDVSAMKEFLFDILPSECKLCILRTTNSSVHRVSYTLCLVLEDGALVELAKACARPCFGFNTVISLDPSDFGKGQKHRSRAYVGKIRSDSRGYAFTLFDDGVEKKKLKKVEERWRAEPLRERREYASILHFEGDNARSSERVMVALPCNIRGWYPASSKYDTLSSHHRELVDYGAYSSEHEQMICMNGWVGANSVKNISLAVMPIIGTAGSEDLAPDNSKENSFCCSSGSSKRLRLTMTKVGKDRFDISARPPLSIFQAFGICLSRFAATKTVRERVMRSARKFSPVKRGELYE